MMTAREFALEVVRRLRQAGFTAYWAGGCVRDRLLGLEPKDYDVATDARPEQIKALFPRRNEIGAAFGVVQVIGPRGPDGQWLTVEVATFRSDEGYSDGRRPDTVTFSGPREDALRRDFTINGMFYDPIRDELIDYVSGLADLENRLLRAIGNPWERFAEDKLRLLRAVRLAARYQLRIEAQTHAAAKAMAPQITIVSPERIADELRKMLSHRTRGQSVRLLRELELIPPLFPELVPTFSSPHLPSVAAADTSWPVRDSPDSAVPDTSGPVRDSITVWDHTVSVVDHLPENASFPLALAALLHGLQHMSEEAETESGQAGKVAQTRNHRSATVAVAESVARRLRLSNAERERVTWLLQHLGVLFDVFRQPPHCWRPLLVESGVEELIALHRAEALAQGGPGLQAVAYCEKLLREWPRQRLDPPQLLRGSDLLAMGIPAGPEIKRLLEAVRQAQWDDRIQTREEALALVQKLRQAPTDDPTKRPVAEAATPNVSACADATAASKNATE